jgi:hypothetical protein
MATKRKRPVQADFTIPQSRALRVAISWAVESEDATLRQTLQNAKRELDRAEARCRP